MSFFRPFRLLRRFFRMPPASRRAAARDQCGCDATRLRVRELEARLTPSVGNLDLTFGALVNGTRTGYAINVIGQGAAAANAVAVQKDNKVVVAGTALVAHDGRAADQDFVVARFNADGTLDTSFGNGKGWTATDFGHGNDVATSVALQTQKDGTCKIVVAGKAWDGGRYDFALARYNADGTLDTTFGVGGEVLTPMGTGDAGARGLVIDTTSPAGAPDSNFTYVVAGTARVGGRDEIAVGRYNLEGGLAGWFGHGGIVLLDSGRGDASGNAVAIDPWDSKIRIAGGVTVHHADGRTDQDFAVVSLCADGRTDQTFGANGWATIDFGFGNDAANSIAVQPDQGLVVAGSASDGQSDYLALARYTFASDANAYELDSGFGAGGFHLKGPNGTVVTAVGSGSDTADAVLVQPNGRIVVAGRSLLEDADNNTHNAFVLVRYNADGSTDQTFGINGQVTTSLSNSHAEVTALAIQTDPAGYDGRLVAAGWAVEGGVQDFAVARYQADTAPIAVDDAKIVTSYGNSILIYVLNNDIDPDGDPLRVTAITTHSGITHAVTSTSDWLIFTRNEGLFASNGSSVEWKPPFGFTGTYTFGYTISDGWLSASAKITVSVVKSTTLRAGDLDPTFARFEKQMVVTDFNHGYDGAQAVAVQSDGKVVTAGWAWNGTNYDFALARYNRDGTLDTTFGQGGKVETDFAGGDDKAYALAIQADGKIVVAGSADESSLGEGLDFALARYNCDGTLDTTFGDGGKVVTDFLSGDDVAKSLVLEPEAGGSFKIVVAGYASFGSGFSAFALARYNSDGSLDKTFGFGGLTAADFSSGFSYAEAVALQSQTGGTMKIIVAGSAYAGWANGYDFALARFNDDGSMDATFGNGGTVTTNIRSSNGIGSADVINALALTPDGQIIAGGSASDPSGNTGSDFALARYTADGQLEESFGTKGVVVTDFAQANDAINALLLTADGSLIAGGYAAQRLGPYGLRDDFALARYTAGGQLDTNFGNQGKVTTDFSGAADEINGLAFQKDGKIIAVGRAWNDFTFDFDFGLAGYNLDGSIDAGFTAGAQVVLNTSGRTETDLGSLYDYGNAVAIQPDGKIVVAGSTWNGQNDDFAVVRYNADGTLDTSFGNGGKVTTDFAGGNDEAYAVAIQRQGDGTFKILVAGTAWEGYSNFKDFALVRYNADGSLDTTFDGGLNGGKVTTDFFGFNDVAGGMVVLADGSIILGGYADNGSYDQIALARYNADGTPDTSFGIYGNGAMTVDNGRNEYANALAVQPADGKIVLAGGATLDHPTGNGQVATNDDFLVARFNPDGTVDSTFGAGGETTMDFGYGDDYANAVAVDSQGRIVAAGTAYIRHQNNSNDDFALLRLNPDGSPDASFFDPGQLSRTQAQTPAGTVATDYGAGSDADRPGDIIHGIAIQPDGKIVAAGEAFNGGNLDFALARYNPDGSLDPRFGNGGTVSVFFRGSNDEVAQAVALQPDGKIVAAGYGETKNFLDYDFAVARFEGSSDATYPPLAIDDTAATAAGQQVVIPVLANDFDQNGNPLHVVGLSQAGGSGVAAFAASSVGSGSEIVTEHGGVVRINPDDTITYTPADGYTGPDAFQYTVSNGFSTAMALVTVHVFTPPSVRAALAGGGIVVGERWLEIASPTEVGIYHGTPAQFAPSPNGFVLLTTGDVKTATDNTLAGADNHTRDARGAFDPVVLDLTLNIPQGMNWLSFDFAFFTNEFPQFRNLFFNDSFIAELDRTTWSVDPLTGKITAPDNFAFDAGDPQHTPLTVKSDLFNPEHVVTLTGTAYNGATPLLEAGTPITPGIHHLYLSIFDNGDGQIDSAVFINHLRALRLPDAVATPANAGFRQPPRALDDWAPFLPGQPITVHVLDNDIDFEAPNQSALGDTIIAVTQPAHGTATFDASSGTVTYTPDPGFNGSDRFTYTIADSRGGTSTATVRLNALLATETTSATAAPMGTALAQIQGLSATLENNIAGSDPVVLTISNYAGTGATRMFDVNTLNARSADVLLVNVLDPAHVPLQYWTGSGWAAVRGVGNTDPIPTDTGFLLIVGGSSHPRVTGLHGTVFSVGVPVPVNTPVNISVPVAELETGKSGRPFIGLTRATTFVGSPQVTLSLTASQDTSETTPGTDRTAPRDASDQDDADGAYSAWWLSAEEAGGGPPKGEGGPGGGNDGTAVPKKNEGKTEKKDAGRPVQGSMRLHTPETQPEAEPAFAAGAVDAFFAAVADDEFGDGSGSGGPASWMMAGVLAGVTGGLTLPVAPKAEGSGRGRRTPHAGRPEKWPRP